MILTQNHTKPVGHEFILSHKEELVVRQKILRLAEWGFPLDIFDLRMLVKAYSDKQGIEELLCHGSVAICLV